MKGRRDFNEVTEWAGWRQRRIGGGKEEEQVMKRKVMINRFLALVGYNEEVELSPLLMDHTNIELYDGYMLKTFEQGTVRAAYCSINNFINYLLYSKLISEAVHKMTKMTIKPIISN
ncbi:uncharacterized protein LOC123524606 [Mercenaria mercenaria]|uniref:uncharacterized protein LOC123524606 n=1 Tax=Mercenaria mercenaria TaxID=6596 RepID=UPI00234F1AE9|nr:uncharacterized protein LOC123524606 [Mercenaria mercenaria]